MAKRTIAILSFAYGVEVDGPFGQKVLSTQRALKGETVDLRDEDVKRGEELGAFETSKKTPAATPAFDVATASDEELAAHIESEKPNVSATVALAGTDAELAQRVLAAENAVTGNDPRAGVLKGLEAVITQANS